MVVTRIMGGLGNQLFQYAAGRRLALANNDQLKLDVSDYAISPRPYRLDRFNIAETIASESEVGRLRGSRNRILRRLPRLRASAMITESSDGFRPLERNGDVYLNGYWQSERYFKEIEQILRTELTLKTPPDRANQAVGTAIQGSESVSLHVRRGDYVSNPLYSRVHGVCPPEYYQAAIELIAREVKDPHFFVFSDDLDWAKDNLKLDHATVFPDHNGEEADYEDLRLMSWCRHHIIANSTFSWWGAWLASNPDKIVIAPKTWFNDPARDSADIIPDSWRRI